MNRLAAVLLVLFLNVLSMIGWAKEPITGPENVIIFLVFLILFEVKDIRDPIK